MTSRERVIAAAGGVLTGGFGGLFGVGGGILLVPLLAGPLRRTQHEAHGTSLATIGATAISGLVVYGLNGHVDWLTAMLAAPTSMMMARVGARVTTRMSSRTLRLAFAAMLVVFAIRLLWAPASGPALFEHVGLAARISLDLAIGAGVGFLAGVFGVGGGILAVPAFTLLLGMSQQMAQGTSLALILLAAPAGAIEHSRRGNVVVRLAIWLAIGSVVGAALTSALVQGAPGPALRRGFAVFMLLNAVPMAVRALREKPGAPVAP